MVTASPYILAIDQGTTSTRAILFDGAGRARSTAQIELTQHYPQPGWVEHDPEEIWQAALVAVNQALIQALDCEPVAVGIANQRETLVVWERWTGKPLYNAIVWQCRRSEAICQELRDQGLEPEIACKTGLRLDPYFSGTKMLWLIREHPELKAR